MRIVIGIATSGRAVALGETLACLGGQTRPPDEIVVSAVAAADIPDLHGLPGLAATRVILGPPGLPRQRNRILEHAAEVDADLVVFFDDDFIPHDHYLRAVESAFEASPDLVLTTGDIIADGIGGPGLDVHRARHLIANARLRDGMSDVFSGYGCNMAVRMQPVRAATLRFDERLPLYGWQEDVDFSRRLAPAGRLARLHGSAGVHLGVKRGRVSGRRFGYSQVANPIYLWRKGGGYPLGRALNHVARNVAMNVARSPRPEAWIDRRGRLAGNLLAFRDLVAGRLAPERVLDLL